MKGLVKWYNPQRGYGFIQIGDGRDVFIHKSNVPSGLNLQAEDKIEFDIEETERGSSAINIARI